MKAGRLTVLVLTLGALLALVLVLGRDEGASGERRHGSGGPGAGTGLIPAGTAESGPVEPGEPGEPGTRTAEAPDGAEATEYGAGLEVVGRVTDGAGRAVVGATVLLAYTDSWVDGALDVEVDGEDETERFELATGAAGGFALSGLRAGGLRGRVLADGFQPLALPARVVPAEGRIDLGELVLLPGLVLEGRVVDPGGRGVPGARLAREDESQGWGVPYRYAPLGTTDVDGRFRLTLAPGQWSLRVTADAHPVAWFHGREFRPSVSAGYVFQLERAWSIRGRLEIPEVTSFEAYEVEARLAGDAAGWHRDNRRQLVDCAPDGTFAFERLRAVDATTRYALRARREYDRGTGAVGESVEVPVGSEGVVLGVEPFAALAFELRAEESGEPIDGATVTLQDAGNNTIGLEADGSLERLGGGRYRVRDIARPSVTERFKLRMHVDGRVDLYHGELGLVGGEERDLGVLSLRLAELVTVRVTDRDDGTPIEGAEVKLESPDAAWALGASSAAPLVHYVPRSGSARTDAAGVARVPRVAGQDVRLSATHEAYAPLLLAPKLEPDVELALELGPGATLTVRVEDSTGAPIAGEPVGVEVTEHQEIQLGAMSLRSGPPNASTDASGEIRFAHVAPGRVEIVHHGETGERERRPLTLVHGEEREVTFVVAPRGTLRLVVTEEGEALAGAEVALYPRPGEDELDAEGRLRPFWERGWVQSATTQSDGSAAFGDREFGEHEVLVSHPTRPIGELRTVHLGADGAPVRIDLAACELSGQVLDEERVPLSGVRVYAVHAEYLTGETLDSIARVGANGDLSWLGLGSTRTDAGGRYVFRGLPADLSTRVVAVPAGHRLALSEPFGAGADGVELPPLIARSAGTLTITLDAGARPELRHALSVELEREGGNGLTWRRSGFDRSSRAELQHLAPGTWRVTLVPRSGMFAGAAGEAQAYDEELVEVVASETAEVTLRR